MSAIVEPGARRGTWVLFECPVCGRRKTVAVGGKRRAREYTELCWRHDGTDISYNGPLQSLAQRRAVRVSFWMVRRLEMVNLTAASRRRLIDDTPRLS